MHLAGNFLKPYKQSGKAPGGLFAPHASRRLNRSYLKNGFWFKIKAGAFFTPEEYFSILRIWKKRPTRRLGQKTF
jgi:hypothetical protein